MGSAAGAATEAQRPAAAAAAAAAAQGSTPAGERGGAGRAHPQEKAGRGETEAQSLLWIGLRVFIMGMPGIYSLRPGVRLHPGILFDGNRA